MENGGNLSEPIFSHVEPVLPVHDITATIAYWQDVLGFPSKWTWGDPPVHGGISWQKVFVQFTLNPERATASKGNSIWIRLKHIDFLYDLHTKNSADIVSPPEDKPWGMTEYVVREINGYYLHFAGVTAERKASAQGLPQTIQIISRKPSVNEYRSLATSVGWSPSNDDAVIEAVLAAPLFAVVAEDTSIHEAVGCALLLGDNATFYYVKDVMVQPKLQRNGVGTAMMRVISDWLQTNAANNALAALISGETLETFYQRFGFAPAFSMVRYIHR